jgi:hypothetical protein
MNIPLLGQEKMKSNSKGSPLNHGAGRRAEGNAAHALSLAALRRMG